MLGTLLHATLVAAVPAGLLVLLLVATNLLLVPRLSRARPVADGPRVSIVVPARNEEREVAAAVGSLLAQDYEDFEVLVVEDRSTDGTARILARLARESPRLKVIPGRDPPPGWLGKPHALSLGAREATGEILLFVDADVRYDPRCLAQLVGFLLESRVEFVALLPRLEARGFWENVLMPYVLTAYFFGPGLLANSDRARWIAAGGGAGNMVRRRAYEALGGHAAIRDSVIDDIHLALRAKRAGYRSRAVLAHDRAAVRMYRGFREVWDGFSKNMAYAFNGALGVLLAMLTAVSVLLAVVPPGVLLARMLGAEVAPADLWLAATGTALPILARMLLAGAFGDPLWPAVTHALMSAVWAGIIGRSFFHRVVRRRLTWRGREFDARSARF